jgi:hypothetical protein
MTRNPKVQYAEHGSEAGHWYDPVARLQVETIIGSKGEPVRPDLRHARKHGWYPGVTTILREASAPQLERWKIKQAVLAALTLPRQPDEADEVFLARVFRDGEEQANKAADEGTRIHAALQRFYETGTVDEYYAGKVRAAHAALEQCCGSHQQWHTEQIAFAPLGYATKVDLHCQTWVVDWKTKDFGPADLNNGALDVYDSHWKQLAAGHRALGDRVAPLENCRCAIGYVSRTHDLAVVLPVDAVDLCRGLAMFDCLLTHWKLRTGYDPTCKETPTAGQAVDATQRNETKREKHEQQRT